MARLIEGEVLKLRCSSCAAEFPSFRFSGENDTVTIGLAAVTSISGNEVALAEMMPDECGDQGFGLRRFAKRMSHVLGREFRAVPLVRAIDHNWNLKGLSFQEFRSRYRAPQLVFSCPQCGGEALEKESRSSTEFVSEGGFLTVVGDLTLG
jgi:hypothetical protein